MKHIGLNKREPTPHRTELNWTGSNAIMLCSMSVEWYGFSSSQSNQIEKLNVLNLLKYTKLGFHNRNDYGLCQCNGFSFAEANDACNIHIYSMKTSLHSTQYAHRRWTSMNYRIVSLEFYQRTNLNSICSSINI